MDSRALLRLRSVIEDVRTSLWFLPTLAVLGAIIVAQLLIQVRITDGSLLAGLVFGGGADGARGMLQAVAGSVITVTSLVFTMTLVTLQLASSQFSPRLLRTFLRDRGNQVVLSMFLATFAYSLTVLRTIRSDAGDDGAFVPQAAVTGTFVLAMASVAALVYFLHHITQEIRVDTMMRDVERDTRRTIGHAYPDPLSAADAVELAPSPPVAAAAIAAPRSGFIQDVAVDALESVASEHDVIVRVHAAVGEAVTDGAPWLWVWTQDGETPADDVVGVIRDAGARAIQVGHERTPQRDVAFGLRQLVDIAAKALSPGVNDPTTAVHAIAHLGSLLGELARRQLDALVRRDADGLVRVGVSRPDFSGYLDLACGQIRRYGADEPAVAIAMLRMLSDVAACAETDVVRAATSEQATLVLAAAEREIAEPHDLEQVREAAAAVERAIHGDRRP